MDFDQWSGRAQRPFAAAASAVPGETVAEHRVRVSLQQSDRIERRERECLEQRSPELTAVQRLRLWERLHQLRIPAVLRGTLATVIAGDTGLTIEQLNEAMLERAQPPAA